MGQSSPLCSHHHRATVNIKAVNPSSNVLSSLEGMNPFLAFSLGLHMNFVGARVGMAIDDIGVWGVVKGALGFRVVV